jgi:NTE family protein
MARRGLVLGGGGFFGAFEAGVYEVTGGEFDCIAGASAGALNGWAVASGMPADELQRLWRRAAESARAGLHRPRYWGDGLLAAGKLEAMVRELVRDWRPRVPLGVVVSRGWSFRQELLTGDDVTADALLASCAVPGLLPGRHLNGALAMDGGLRDACPLWTARAMGAEEIVGVNVWKDLPWWYPRRERRRGGEGVTMIEPVRRLAPLRRSALAGPEEVDAWIELGRRAARAVFARQ